MITYFDSSEDMRMEEDVPYCAILIDELFIYVFIMKFLSNIYTYTNTCICDRDWAYHNSNSCKMFIVAL